MTRPRDLEGSARRRDRPAERRRGAALGRRAATAATRTRSARSRSASRPSRRWLAGRVGGGNRLLERRGRRADGAAAARRREFRVDELRRAAYPELVLTTRARRSRRTPELVRSAIAALRRGYEATLDDPDAAVKALTDGAPGTDAMTAMDELDAVAPAFLPSGGQFGELDAASCSDWATWEAEFGIVRRPPERRERLFDSRARRGGLSSACRAGARRAADPRGAAASAARRDRSPRRARPGAPRARRGRSRPACADEVAERGDHLAPVELAGGEVGDEHVGIRAPRRRRARRSPRASPRSRPARAPTGPSSRT